MQCGCYDGNPASHVVVCVCSSGTKPFFRDEDTLCSGVLQRFTAENVPSGGWHVDDLLKFQAGTFFVQGRNQFYWYATRGSKEEELYKVPGDMNSRSNKFMPSGRHREHVPSPTIDWMY